MKTDPPTTGDSSPLNPASNEDSASDALTFQRNAAFCLRAIMENLQEAIYFKDLDSRFLIVSQSHVDKCNIGPVENHIGKTDSDIFAPDFAQQTLKNEQQIIRTGEPILNVEEKEVWPDGSVTWVSSSKMPLFSDEGEIIGIFGISRDITARKQAEQDLKAAQTELLEASRLAGMAEISTGILHNIGNALNSVNTSASLVYTQIQNSRLSNLGKVATMLDENIDRIGDFLTSDERGAQLPSYLIQLTAQLEKEHEGFLAEISHLRKSIEHINSIVAMQQVYSRAPDVAEEADPAELIEEALQISEISLSRHGINVKRDFTPVPKIRVTRHKVLVILINFIRNAKYAMDEAGRPGKDMVIELRKTDEKIHITVRDNGIGIAPENRPLIFNFGFTTRENGHGFGLHSSANAAREIGARIHFDSDGIDQGASFTLELPHVPPAEVPD